MFGIGFVKSAIIATTFLIAGLSIKQKFNGYHPLLLIHDPDFQSCSAKHASQVELYLSEQSEWWFNS
jgi:hypothetical protein